MPHWYVGCLDVCDGQVKTGQVRIGPGQVNSGRSCQDRSCENRSTNRQNPNHNSTQHQPNITLGWVRHENDFANHPTPHRNSMSAISQPLLARF